MPTKVKISLYSGPKDGLVLYWDDLDTDLIFFDYTSMSRVHEPDFSNFEYHVYSLASKPKREVNEYVFNYEGVTPIEPQDEEYSEGSD